jgi:hypothetical protein
LASARPAPCLRAARGPKPAGRNQAPAATYTDRRTRYPSEVVAAESGSVLDAPLLMKPFLITELEQAVRELLGPSQ